MSEAVIKKKLLFQPRDYQLYYLEKAKEQNVIICLGTGSGKTYITIMLLIHFGDKIKKDNQKAIFLAPTVPLVMQQADEIIKHTNYETKVFYGDLGVDNWDEKKWREQIESNEVLVMIPDVFFSILSKQIIDIEKICVIIFDEAHHGGLKRKSGSNSLEETRHTYKKIMKLITSENFHNKIRIIGTTASVVNGCHDPILLNDCFKDLQITFNARILGEFEFDPRFLAEPNIMVWLFKETIKTNEQYCELFSVINKMDVLINEEKRFKENYMNTMLNVHSINHYLLEKPLIKPSYIKRIIRDIWEVQNELGVFAAYLVCIEFKKELVLIKNSVSDENLCSLTNLAINFLTICENFYSKSIRKLNSIGLDNAMLNLATAKLLRLLDIIHASLDVLKEFSALVFVDRVLFSFAISKYLECLADTGERFSYIKPNFFVGVNNEYLNFKFIKESVKNFKSTIKEFKDGNLNILVTTSVLEEGIDIGKCNLVIRFSEAKTYREFVQSKGRGRAKNAFFVIMHDDKNKLDNQMKIFSKTEEFLNFQFKLSKESKFNESVLPDDYQIIDEEEVIKSETGASMQLHEAGPFLNRYIIKKGNNNYVPTYSIEELEFGFRVKLNLLGVTPLKEEIVGKIHTTSKEAFKSSCLKACEELYRMGQLDDHFIPIGDDQVVKKCDLINRTYNREEATELNLIFNSKNRQRLFYKKNINSFNYFKNFIKKNGYDIYEINFKSDDKYLKSGDEKLILITELNLNEHCLATILYSSLYTSTVELKLIERDSQLNERELEKVFHFTLAIWKNAIPIFKKREDLKFNREKCLFKFAFLNQVTNEIDYEQMNKIVNLNEENLENNLIKGENNLVKATHTNTDYKLVSTTTNVYPNDSFFMKSVNKNVTYNEYFKNHYDRLIKNQHEQLIQVEKADLISTYSIYVKPEENTIEEDKTSKFNVYLPREFCVISSITKSLHKKLTCLSPLIYRIKQKIILKNIYSTLNQDVLNATEATTDNPIFDDEEKNLNDIDDYINEIFKKKPSFPFFEDSETSSDEEKNDQEDIEEISAQEIDQQISNQFKSAKRKKQTIYCPENSSIVYVPGIQSVIDDILLESLQSTLRQENCSRVQDYTQRFLEQFENLVKPDLKANYKNFCDIEPKLKKRKMDECDELMKINFNDWTNQVANNYLISQTTLLESLTTKSAMDAINLERLEFLGDTFLKFVTCSLLFHLYPDSPVGELDILKNRTVSNKNLYGISKRKRLLEFIFSDNFLPGMNWLPDGFEYTKPDPNSSERSVTLIDTNGFRISKMNLVNRNQYQELKAKTVADSVEGLIGGVLVSSGMRNASLFMKYLGIYSDQYKLSIECEQKNWFIGDGKKYDPMTRDQLGRKAEFIETLYRKYDFYQLEKIIDYEFKNKALLVQAFKHVSFSSFDEMPSYENLEFLGDSVIDLLIAKYFYYAKECFSPGQLSNLKQSLINNQFFGSLSVKYGLDKYLIFNCPTLFNMIGTYKTYYNEVILPKGDKALIIPSSYLILDEPESINFDESIEIHKTLGDIFESLIGAIFIDADFCLNTVWRVLHKFMIKELIKFRQNPPKTFLSQMHELYPQNHFGDVRVENNKTLIDIQINGIVFSGSGLNKKLAKMDCAKQVIKHYISSAKNEV